jgi:hypothetical protein
MHRAKMMPNTTHKYVQLVRVIREFRELARISTVMLKEVHGNFTDMVTKYLLVGGKCKSESFVESGRHMQYLDTVV